MNLRIAALTPVLLLAAGTPPARPPDRLPALARELLVARMAEHKSDMEALTRAVILLDRASVEKLAATISEQPRLARGAPASSDLNSMLPPRFFELQDQLLARAQNMAKAARAGDDAALGKAYGKLAETCVACHSSYLEPGKSQP